MNTQTVMMRGILASFVLCTFAFMQVELYVITVDNLVTSAPDSPITVSDFETFKDFGFNYDVVYNYEITFSKSDEDNENLPLSFLYIYEDDIVYMGNTSLCEADFSSIEGTAAAIVALVLGIKNDPVCPLQETTMSQQSVFNITEGSFPGVDDIDEDDILSLKLEVYSSTFMAMKLSITEDDDWEEEDFAEDPDEDTPDGENDEDGDSSNDGGANDTEGDEE